MPVCACNDYSARNDAYYKTSLVKVLDIIRLDAVLGDCIFHKPKPVLNDVWIFALGYLTVISTKKTRLELSVSLDKVGSLSLADRWRVAVGE